MSRLLGARSRSIPSVVVVGVLAAAVATGMGGGADQGPPDDKSPRASQLPVRDQDADGLADQDETSGWLTQGGRSYITDPAVPDTDGDGLTDGQEAGSLVVSAIRGAAYAGRSDPTRSDSDGDGLDDATEADGGYNAWSQDSDGDGLEDLVEIEFGSDPKLTNADGDHLDDREELEANSDPNFYDLTVKQAGVAFAGGLVAGDWNWLAHRGGLTDEQINSWAYLAGSITSGFVAVGDLRDTGANLSSGDWHGALKNLTEVLPVFGDALKMQDSVVTFAKRGRPATQAALCLLSFTPAVQDAHLADVVRVVVRLDPTKARLSADAAVRGVEAPGLLSSTRPISSSERQNAVKDEIVRDLNRGGYTDIRVNQQQVDAAGVVVGLNRPDIQGTAPNGTRHYYEIDASSAERGPSHLVRLLSNDDDGEVHLVQQD